MNRAALRELTAEWYGKADALARSRGDRDIETPKGDFRGNGRKVEGKPVGTMAYHAQAVHDGSFELATAKRRFLHSHRWPAALDRGVWEYHVDGVSARETARRMGHNRKTVDRALARGLAAFERRDAPKRGRPREEDSLRSEGMWLPGTLLSEKAALALDHLRTVLKVPKAEAVRRALVEYARRISSAT